MKVLSKILLCVAVSFSVSFAQAAEELQVWENSDGDLICLEDGDEPSKRSNTGERVAVSGEVKKYPQAEIGLERLCETNEPVLLKKKTVDKERQSMFYFSIIREETRLLYDPEEKMIDVVVSNIVADKKRFDYFILLIGFAVLFMIVDNILRLVRGVNLSSIFALFAFINAFTASTVIANTFADSTFILAIFSAEFATALTALCAFIVKGTKYYCMFTVSFYVFSGLAAYLWW